MDIRTHVQEIAEHFQLVLLYLVQDMEQESDTDIQFQEMQQLDKAMVNWLKGKLVKDSDHVLLQTAELLQDKCLIL